MSSPAGGSAMRLMPLLARPAGLFLPVIVRRYGRDIDAMFGDASPADAPEDSRRGR